MESKVSNAPTRTANNEVPVVDFFADGPEPRYRLTTLGHVRLIRARALLDWLKCQTSDSVHQDMLAVTVTAPCSQALLRQTPGTRHERDIHISLMLA